MYLWAAGLLLVRVRPKIHKYIVYGPKYINILYKRTVYARGEGGALQKTRRGRGRHCSDTMLEEDGSVKEMGERKLPTHNTRERERKATLNSILINLTK